jgi:hypothetical protein
MPGGFFGRGPSRFPYEQIAQRRPQMAPLLGHHQLPSGTTSQQAAEILMEAIENKRTKAASDVVLLLDAARLP